MSETDPERVELNSPYRARGKRERSASSADFADSGAHGHAGQMNLAELTDAADVSVRTVRYYIAEGLLPPPQGSGPSSAYSPGHLARLRLIQRLKEAYLPLKEIRRRLSGLEDDEVLAILAYEEASPSAADAVFSAPDASMAGARDYLSLLESRAQYRTEPLALSLPVTPPASASAQTPASGLVLQQDVIAPQMARSASVGAAEGIAERQLAEAVRAPHDARQEEELWRRIRLGDEAELVISDRVYGRHQDRVDWLVRWARKVFD